MRTIAVSVTVCQPSHSVGGGGHQQGDGSHQQGDGKGVLKEASRWRDGAKTEA